MYAINNSWILKKLEGVLKMIMGSVREMPDILQRCQRCHRDARVATEMPEMPERCQRCHRDARVATEMPEMPQRVWRRLRRFD